MKATAVVGARIASQSVSKKNSLYLNFNSALITNKTLPTPNMNVSDFSKFTPEELRRIAQKVISQGEDIIQQANAILIRLKNNDTTGLDIMGGLIGVLDDTASFNLSNRFYFEGNVLRDFWKHEPDTEYLQYSFNFNNATVSTYTEFTRMLPDEAPSTTTFMFNKSREIENIMQYNPKTKKGYIFNTQDENVKEFSKNDYDWFEFGVGFI